MSRLTLRYKRNNSYPAIILDKKHEVGYVSFERNMYFNIVLYGEQHNFTVHKKGSALKYLFDNEKDILMLPLKWEGKQLIQNFIAANSQLSDLKKLKSKKEQVRFMMEGVDVEDHLKIAKTIGSDPSYVKRLIKQIKDEDNSRNES